MDYIPTAEMCVIKGIDSDGLPRWKPLSAHDLNVLLDSNVAEEDLASYFPGCGFYGPLIGSAAPEDMGYALTVLRMTLELHAMLSGCDSLVTFDRDDWSLPTLRRVYRVEDIANSHLQDIYAMLSEYPCLVLTRGCGYDEKFNGEDCIPQCHILHAEFSLPPVYSKWLAQRTAIYNAVASTMRSGLTYYLRMHNQASIITEDGTSKLQIDVYGTQTLDSRWDDWLKAYEGSLDETAAASALESVAGLRHLADLLATIHLSTALPIVEKGRFGRFGAEDSLTDLWRRCYDYATDANHVIGPCKVCGRLYIGTHKGKRGHAACMNRQRVAKSRSRKFADLIKAGSDFSEASKMAGIDTVKALRMLRGEGKSLSALVDSEGGSSSLVLRKAKIDDAYAVFSLAQEAIQSAYTNFYHPAVVECFKMLHSMETIKGDIKTGNTTVIACGGRMLAIGTIDSNRISRVFVDPLYSGVGLGSCVMDALEREAYAIGHRSTILAASIPGKDFFIGRGYETIRIETWHPSDMLSLEHEIMAKSLGR